MDRTQISPAPVAAGNGAMKAGNLAQNYTAAPPAAKALGAAAQQYTEAGIALVALRPGTKRPTGKGWNRLGGAITDPSRAGAITGGIGIHHLASRTCAIDVDDWRKAVGWFAEHGIDLAALFMDADTVQIQSGRDNRAKMLFRLPDSVDWLPHLNAAEDGLELRCANGPHQSQQDVLPPSVHPDTGKPYQWGGDWRAIPTLPEEVLAAWLAESGHCPDADRPQTSPVSAVAHIDAPKGTYDLFERRIPNRPYAADELGPGLRRMSPEQALKCRHLQINPPSIRFWLAFDIDDQSGAMAWDEAGLPEPAWTAQNPSNGHAHSVWGIEAPVLLDKPDRQKPVRYLAAIESAYRASLGADPAYGGLLTKNPLSSHWRTYWGQYGVYGLDELAEYVDLDRHKPKRGIDVEESGLGRNVTLFDHVRHYAYRNLRHYIQTPTAFRYWQRVVHGEAMSRNGDFPVPLPTSEVWHVAKSIAGWTWKKFDVQASDRRWRDRQSRRGSRKGQSKRDQLMPIVMEMRAKGMSQRSIGEEIGVSAMTVSNWLRTPDVKKP